MPSSDLPFSVVGSGPVAREMGRVFTRDGGRCVGVLSRSLERARATAAYLSAPVATTRVAELPREARVLFVATRDDAIVDVARELGAAGAANGRTLVHFAGSLSATVMRLPETESATVVSIHPLRHFELAHLDPSTFPGTFCAIDGDPAPSEEFSARVRAAGGVPFRVPSEAKQLYMASVLLPITLMPALIAEAERGLDAAGLTPTDTRALISHLVRLKCADLVARPAAEALHGPIAHGDVPVMARVIEVVGRLHPALLPVFRVLGESTLAHAIERRLLSPSRAQEMRRALGIGSVNRA